jgi:glycosyltransferase involved in cell wall biosynthesis
MLEESNPIDVIILAFNEERHIVRAIRSVSSFARSVFVVDSFSTDRTAELARACGATICQHPFVNQARQFQWAMDHCPGNAPWMMRLDADEVIEPDLAAEIARKIPALPPDIVGVNLKRKHYFQGRWVRHGGRYPVILTRIWRRGNGHVEDRWMDEHIIVSGGRTVEFDGSFRDDNLGDLSGFTDKHNRYATREAIEILNRRYGFFPEDRRLRATNSSRQASVKRFIKRQAYERLPFTVAAMTYFLWRYVGQLGFLDGRSGTVYHFLQGYWYRFLVGAKVMEFDRSIRPLAGNRERLEELERLTGYRLAERRADA